LIYSRYTLSQKDKIKEINSVCFWCEKFKHWDVLYVFDDNTQSGETLKSIFSFLQMNWFWVKLITGRNIILARKKPHYYDKLDKSILLASLPNSISWYYRGDRKLFTPLEHKRKILYKQFGKFLKD